MPNYAYHKMIVNGSKKDIEKFIQNSFTEEKGELLLDFEKIIPVPDNIYRGPLGAEERKKYGRLNWYDWSVENWGTKWNACYTVIHINNDKELVLDFSTAWDTPEPIIQKIVEDNPKLSFKIYCVEEGGFFYYHWYSEEGVFEPIDKLDFPEDLYEENENGESVEKSSEDIVFSKVYNIVHGEEGYQDLINELTKENIQDDKESLVYNFENFKIENS